MFGSRYVKEDENMAKPYTATKLPGKVTRTVHRYEQVGTKATARGFEVPVYRRVTKEIEEAAGHIVKFAFGHSIRVRPKKERRSGIEGDQMTHMGFDKDPGLVHMLTGDVIVPNREKVADKMELATLLPANYSTPAKGGKHASS